MEQAILEQNKAYEATNDIMKSAGSNATAFNTKRHTREPSYHYTIYGVSEKYNIGTVHRHENVGHITLQKKLIPNH